MEAWRNELYHYGIKNMKWGTRRYRNYDGTLTNAGKIRYRYNNSKNDSDDGLSGSVGASASEEFASSSSEANSRSSDLSTSRERTINRARGLDSAVSEIDKKVVNNGKRFFSNLVRNKTGMLTTWDNR